MKKIAIYGLLLFLFAGCKKAHIVTTDLLPSFKIYKQTINADGSTLVDITAEVNPDADENRRTVIFSAGSGSFVGGTDSTISKKATFEAGILIARVRYKAPLTPGLVTIRAKVDLSNEKTDYIQSDTIRVLDSKPAKIQLSASAFAVKINFANEVTITGLLSNNEGKFVSLGNKVVFTDAYDDGSPVNGQFRQLQNSSDASSGVSVSYTPGNILSGRKINIACEVLNKTGNKTGIKDIVQLTTIPEK